MGEQRSPNTMVKSFEIAKQEVVVAWEQVKANRGAAGVDAVSVAEFEKDLKGNLYKIWNRMSSGTYFPPAVKAVQIPKPHGGGVRVLGIPTVADRVAQTVAANRLGAKVEPIFDPNSYGYRPGRSALDAVEVCRRRCWEYDWVIDLDVQKFFDTVDWDLMVRAVTAHVHVDGPERWLVLYVQRWLAAPVQMPDGAVVQRDRGTPQGSAISPVLANLFMHYVFDTWLVRKFSTVAFERYADDAVVHCHTRQEAEQILAAIKDRMAEVGLRLHPDKTRIVYCKDGVRRGDHDHTSFTFLGYTFTARSARARTGNVFTRFLPAISGNALKKIADTMRSWRLPRRTDLSVAEIARWINPIIGGWLQYYGKFYRSRLYPLLKRINAYLMRWLRNKYRRLRPYRKALAAWQRMTRQYPYGFAHWPYTTGAWR